LNLLLVIKIFNCVPFYVICMETLGIIVVFAIIGIRNTVRIVMSEVLDQYRRNVWIIYAVFNS
jgi:hypothetical protein